MSTTKTLPRFIIMTAAACMPGTCWGEYGRIAVVELEPGTTEAPKMISTRARGVRRIVSLEDRLHVGGRYSAFGLAKARAIDLCDDLNGQWGELPRAAALRGYGVSR